jgi:ABC-type multidrug transport system fused ATPase/permease subunit
VAPDRGNIFVDGHLLSESDQLRHWRRRFTMVTQDSPMFKRTLRENLTYGMQNVTDETLAKALSLSCMSEWVSELKDGLETVLEGRESQLSGGQRQRIQLCRAFLSQKAIFFMVISNL